MNIDTVKAGQPLITLLRAFYESRLPVLLVGTHGIGKSEILAEAAKAIGGEFIARDLSLMEPPDLIGLPEKHEGRTIYLPPAFLPTDGIGFMIFEELNRAPTYMQSPCLQLLTSRTLNDYRLPDGWLLGAAINPSDGPYAVSELDAALLSRFVQVAVEPDITEWLNWAGRSGVHPRVVKYVESDRTVFDRPESNPRSWTYVSRLLFAAEKQATPATLLRTGIIGLVGHVRGAAFAKTLGQVELALTADDVLKSYPACRARIQQAINCGRLNVVQETLMSVLKKIQPAAGYDSVRGNKRQWDYLGQFLWELPEKFRKQAKLNLAQRKHEFPPQPAKRREAGS